METEWVQRISAAVGQEVQRRRLALALEGIDIEQLTDDLGYKIPRSVLSKIETGTRKQVSLPEVLILAAALGTTPDMLIAPISRGRDVPTVPLLPGCSTETASAHKWLTSVGSAPSQRMNGVMNPNRTQRLQQWRVMDSHSRKRLGEHDAAVKRFERLLDDLGHLKFEYRDRKGDLSSAPEDLASIRSEIADRADEVDKTWDHLIEMRDEMRISGIAVPRLSGPYTKVESGEEAIRPWNRGPDSIWAVKRSDGDDAPLLE